MLAITSNTDLDITAFRNNLNRDVYEVELRDRSVRLRRPLISKNQNIFLYRDLLHEFLDAVDRSPSWGPAKGTVGLARGLRSVAVFCRRIEIWP